MQNQTKPTLIKKQEIQFANASETIDRQPFKLLEGKQAQPALIIPREKVTLNESFLAVKIDSMQAPALVKSVLSVPKHQHSRPC